MKKNVKTNLPYRNLIVHDHQQFFEAINSICAEKPFATINRSAFEIPQGDIPKPKGFRLNVNKETGKKYPNCCKYHKGVLDEATKWFEKFPNCCEHHKKLNSAKWFRKEDYSYVPEKIVMQLAYTDVLIQQKINDHN